MKPAGTDKTREPGPRTEISQHPSELEAVKDVLDWNLDAQARSAIDQILRRTIADPIGPEFMAPPVRNTVAA
jgi:hypothetical protein